jgi:hypothetical protein
VVTRNLAVILLHHSTKLQSVRPSRLSGEAKNQILGRYYDMSLNRFVGLGIFALSSSVLVTLAACDDSTTVANPPAAAGGSSATTTPGQGGGNNSTTQAASNGGSSTNNNTAKGGSTSGNTTAASQGGSGDTTASTGSGTCSADIDLVAKAGESDTKNWIGGDEKTADDNPCGVQGAIYVYGDTGLDKEQFNADDSVQSPGPDTTTDAKDDYVSACADGKCCIKGKTTLWPVDDKKVKDYTASVWGGGIGVTLGDPGGGGAKSPYSGSATGFSITLSGTTAGQAIRIQYTQSTDTAMTAPFKEVTKMGTYDVPFTGVSCPSWADVAKCKDVGTTPFDLQIQVVGGDAAGDFEVCLSGLKPLL